MMLEEKLFGVVMYGPNTSDPATCNIYNNINNGYISGGQVGDVFDTIVNK